MGDCSLGNFNAVYGSKPPARAPRGESRPTTLEREMFVNPYYSEYTLSRITRARQHQLHVENSWTTGTPSCENPSSSTDFTSKGDGHTSKLLASILLGEMATAVVSTLGFIGLADKKEVPIWLTVAIFTISAVVMTIYVTLGRRTYPANVFAYVFFLNATLILILNANLTGYLKFHIYNLEIAALCCFAGSLAFFILTYLPLIRVRRKQLLYSLPPILLTLAFAVVLSVTLYQQTPWSSFGIVPMAAMIMVPSAFGTTIMIKHYTLCI